MSLRAQFFSVLPSSAFLCLSPTSKQAVPHGDPRSGRLTNFQFQGSWGRVSFPRNSKKHLDSSLSDLDLELGLASIQPLESEGEIRIFFSMEEQGFNPPK